jgi:hypothetical protein
MMKVGREGGRERERERENPEYKKTKQFISIHNIYEPMSEDEGYR